MLSNTAGGWKGSAAEIEISKNSGRHDQQADELGCGKSTTEHESPAHVSPEKLQYKTSHSVQHQIGGKNLASKVPLLVDPKQEPKNQERRPSLVELGWMQGYVDGHSDVLVSVLAGKGDSPRQLGRFAVIAACSETTQPSDRLSQGNGWSSSVGDEPKLQLGGPPNEYCAAYDGPNQPAVKDTARLLELQGNQT